MTKHRGTTIDHYHPQKEQKTMISKNNQREHIKKDEKLFYDMAPIKLEHSMNFL